MTETDALGRASPPARDVRADRLDLRLVDAIARLPFTLRTKLIGAFAAIAVLLVVVALLGLRVLGESNARVVELGTLQLRAATYQRLQTQTQQLRQMLAVRVAEDPSLNTYTGGREADLPRGRSWVLVDTALAAALSQIGPAANEARFGFSAPPADAAILARVRRVHAHLTGLVEQVIASDRSNTQTAHSGELLREAIAADNELGALTDRLATTTRAQTDRLIAENRGAFASSRNLVLGVGAASILLALGLGFVLSRSLVDPIRKTEGRLAEIAAGDFSRHVDVPNRDELGALATNLNAMNNELRRLYQELETVSRHKSEFVANMSHELRTPLNAVIGFSELLREQRVGPLTERQRGYVEDILDAGRHLLSLINEILDLAKIEAGHMELDLGEVSLRDVLESGLTMHEERASEAEVTLTLTLENEVTLAADERKLRQVVFNLLSNAVKFTPPGGSVDVRTRRMDGFVEVAVSDTGAGIAPADRELIFEEFRQGRERSRGHQEGTGLGLPLSRRFVELHGGRLWVESVVGTGSTFRFTLPLGSPR
jgi:signal transduction histidine kinase